MIWCHVNMQHRVDLKLVIGFLKHPACFWWECMCVGPLSSGCCLRRDPRAAGITARSASRRPTTCWWQVPSLPSLHQAHDMNHSWPYPTFFMPTQGFELTNPFIIKQMLSMHTQTLWPNISNPLFPFVQWARCAVSSSGPLITRRVTTPCFFAPMKTSKGLKSPLPPTISTWWGVGTTTGM